MEVKNNTFLHALKLGLIWNALVDLSLAVFLVLLIIAFAYSMGGPGVSDSISILCLVLGSLAAGLIQWNAFWNRIKHAYWWILATTLGWSLAGVLLALYITFEGEFSGVMDRYGILVFFLVGAIAGAVIGLPQWLVLRRKVPKAGLWLAASIVGWACTFWAVAAPSQPGEGTLGSLIDPLIVALIGLLPMGMITGVAYAFLFTQPGQREFS